MPIQSVLSPHHRGCPAAAASSLSSHRTKVLTAPINRAAVLAPPPRPSNTGAVAAEDGDAECDTAEDEAANDDEDKDTSSDEADDEVECEDGTDVDNERHSASARSLNGTVTEAPRAYGSRIHAAGVDGNISPPSSNAGESTSEYTNGKCKCRKPALWKRGDGDAEMPLPSSANE